MWEERQKCQRDAYPRIMNLTAQDKQKNATLQTSKLNNNNNDACLRMLQIWVNDPVASCLSF